jgi:hypothetical protein
MQIPPAETGIAGYLKLCQGDALDQIFREYGKCEYRRWYVMDSNQQTLYCLTTSDLQQLPSPIHHRITSDSYIGLTKRSSVSPFLFIFCQHAVTASAVQGQEVKTSPIGCEGQRF